MELQACDLNLSVFGNLNLPSETRLRVTASLCELPGGEGLQLVVGQVKHPEVAVACQERDALVRQAVIGHIELLQAAEAVLR